MIRTFEYSAIGTYPSGSSTMQQPETATTETERAATSFLEQIAAEPALLQLAVLVIVGILFWMLMARMSRAVREARSRAAMQDFLLGVEQALQGDAKGAAKRLERVLAEDPENTTARLFYAEALAELGDPGEAHKHHVQLARGFGVETRRNRLSAARSLLEVDRAAEAIEPAQAAVADDPSDVEAHRVLLRAQLGAGQPADAGKTAQRLALLLPPGDERDRVRAEGARAFSLAARVRLQSGDLSEARHMIELAGRCDPDSDSMQRLAARVEFARNPDDLVRQLTATAGGERPDPNEPLLPAPLVEASTPAAALAKLAPREAFVCGACDGSVPTRVAVCPHCGAKDRIAPWEPDLYREIESPIHVVDAIEENRAHIRRLLGRAAQDDESAKEEILSIGDGAVEETLSRAVEAGVDDMVFVPLLQRMGAQSLPALFDAYRKRKDDWLARLEGMLGGQTSAAVVGRIVQSFGREALPEFEGLLDSADRDLRKIIIDFYVGLADQTEFAKILDRFPPVELVRRLDAAPADVLRRFLATVEAGSFQAEVLLLQPAFTRDLDVFLAVPAAQDPGVLEQVLVRRGLGRTMERALIAHLADADLGPIASRLLDAFTSRALSAQISAFTDPDRDAAVRELLRERLSNAGAAAVGPLCDCFGSSPTPLDDDLVGVLVAIGDDGVEPLGEAYRHGSVLEKFARPLIKRHGHRRHTIVRILTQVGSAHARRVLESLRESETDQNLKLRLDQALHKLDDTRPNGDEEGHGQAG